MPVIQQPFRQAITYLFRWISIMLLIVLFVVIAPKSMDSETKEDVSFETWYEKVKTMYTLVEQGKYEEGKKIYHWLDLHLPALSFSTYEMNTNQMKHFLYSFERAGEALTSVTLSDEKRQSYMYSFYLSTDAILSKNNPLWKNVAKQSLPLLEEAKSLIERGEKEKARVSYQEWQHTFEQIRPAMMTGEPESRYMPLISYLEYMERESSWLEREESEDVVKLLSHVQHLIEPARATVDPSFWIVLFSIGTTIMIALTYTGWRKYRGDKTKERLRE